MHPVAARHIAVVKELVDIVVFENLPKRNSVGFLPAIRFTGKDFSNKWSESGSPRNMVKTPNSESLRILVIKFTPNSPIRENDHRVTKQ